MVMAQLRKAAPRKVLSTRTEEWEAVGLGEEVKPGSRRFYLGEIAVLVALIACVIFVFDNRPDLLPGGDLVSRLITLGLLVILGWALARAMSRGVAPLLMRRLDPGTAGTLGFILRLLALSVIFLISLRIAGVRPETLAAGGAFTAVVIGLAAQQTLGNMIAGLVLQVARPFRAGDRVRIVAGALAGPVEGTVASLGLLYTTLVSGTQRMMVPNREVLGAALVPLREPASLDLRARFPLTIGPGRVQELLDEAITVRLKGRPHIELAEIRDDGVIARITATPADPLDGPALADQVLEAIRRQGGAATERSGAGDWDALG